MSTITKESIADTIEGLEHLANSGIQSVYIDMAIAGMRRLLASLEAEPVAYTDAEELRFPHATSDMWRAPLGHGWDLPLYTAPPAPVSLADEMDLLTCHLDGVTETYAEGWNACRAAMLQGADGNSPVIQDSWVACSERMPVDAEQVYLFTDGVVFKDATYNADEQLFYWSYSADTCKASDASHWMPMIMPAAPQQEVK
ncbi:DUF551 domain-containing protein [Enterobacter wuhouensis]|uniref:DUF551 domain-containing protein n=1 Tax=Enterobacter wuhouensis TaxID=2529381 RepID=UPI002FDE301F